MNVKDIRRENTRQLAQSVGGITALGMRLGKTQAQISHLIGRRPLKNIGDRLALQIERSFNKPYGWLDKLHTEINYKNEEITSLQVPQEQKVHWVPLLAWEQITHFVGKDRDSINLQFETLSTQLDVSSTSFAVHVHDESTKKLAGIQIDKDAIFLVDNRVPPQDETLVLAFNDDRSQTKLQKYLTEPSMNPNKYKLDPHRIIGVVRQIIVTL